MFLLKDLPDDDTLRQFHSKYAELDIPSTRLFLRLLKIGSDLLQHLDTFLKSYNLSHGRWITLVLLHREKEKRALPSILAEKQGVTRATMSALLKRLEQDHLVKRSYIVSDGRSHLIQLTPEGQQTLDRVMPEYYQMVAKLFEGQSSEDILKVSGFLEPLLSLCEKA
jgi:MarR family transcriptional regulator, negative regulator of the multidrug operon emrRAB